MNAVSEADILALCERLRHVPVAVVSDVMGYAGLSHRILHSAIRPLAPVERFAGPAICFTGEEAPDRSPLTGAARLIYEADRRLTPGSVAVVNTGGFTGGSVLGGNTLAGWRKRGCIGVVTDGGSRDAAELAGLPTFAGFVTPLSGGKLFAYTSVDDPVSLPGQSGVAVTIHPGDIVHADEDGVAILPRRHLARIVADAERAEAVEQQMRGEIEAGRDRGEVYVSHDRFGHVAKLG
jgi:regulator of RNase E activity RraA